MKSLKAYQYRLKPKINQVTEINQHFGSVRFVKSWAIALRSRYYKRFGKGVSSRRIQDQLVKKKSLPKWSWLNDVNSQALLSALLHEQVANSRKDFHHQITNQIAVKNHATTYIGEDLAVSNMIKNPKLSRHIADVAWGMFDNFLSYKMAEQAGIVCNVKCSPLAKRVRTRAGAVIAKRLRGAFATQSSSYTNGSLEAHTRVGTPTWWE